MINIILSVPKAILANFSEKNQLYIPVSIPYLYLHIYLICIFPLFIHLPIYLPTYPPTYGEREKERERSRDLFHKELAHMNMEVTNSIWIWRAKIKRWYSACPVLKAWEPAELMMQVPESKGLRIRGTKCLSLSLSTGEGPSSSSQKERKFFSVPVRLSKDCMLPTHIEEWSALFSLPVKC